MTHKQQAEPNTSFAGREKQRAEALRETLRKRAEQLAKKPPKQPGKTSAKKDK